MSDANVNRSEVFFGLLYQKLYQRYQELLSDSQKDILRADHIPTGGAYALMKVPEGYKVYVSERQKDKLNGFFRK